MKFLLPDLGEGVAEAEIQRWLVKQGQQVREDDPMVEVMTDKAAVEIPSPATGVIGTIHVEDGQVVPVGTPLVEIVTEDGPELGETAGDHAPAPAAEAAPKEGPAAGSAARVQATPLVRKLAQSLGVDLTSISGSGANGRITEQDVRQAAGGLSEDRGAQEIEGTRRVALKGIRRLTAEHLTQAQLVPTVTVVEEADLTDLAAQRAEAGISYLPYLIHASLKGFEAVPEANATFDSKAQELVIHERADIGVAVQTEAGLVVPVVRDCAARGLEELDEEIGSLAEQARAGSLSPEQLRGGTFTITSAGRHGGVFTTPLLNVPQVAILGLHRVAERPAVVDRALAVRTTAYLSLSFDHRAFDGITASTFLLSVVEHLSP